MSLMLSGCKSPKFVMTPARTVEEDQRFLYYFYPAQKLFEEGEYQKSFELMQFCYKLNPNDAMVNQYLGDFFIGMHKEDVALAFYERSQANDPKNEKIWQRLRDCYMHQRLPDKALWAQDELDKQNGYDYMSAITRYYIYSMKNDVDRAMQSIDDYLATDPENVQFLRLKVQLYEFMPKAKIKDKIAAYRQLIAADPYNTMVLNNYAYLLATHKGDLKEAEALSRRTLQSEPNNPVYLDTYAWILYLQGEQTLAKLYIQQAVNKLGEQQEPEVQQHYDIIMKGKK
ncbi:MAG: tetratricopeptide repeat protein [Paludibacteraceae bacterium]|nr:tetratricopeptide repeat protein [Paludibacteraceae bacterium]